MADPRVDASHEEATEFVDALLSMGLLRFRSPAAAREADWIEPFAKVLTMATDDEATRLVGVLRETDAMSRSFESADSPARAGLAGRLRAAVDGTLDAIGASTNRARELPFYEDCGAALQVQVSRTSMGPVLGALGRFLERVLPVAYPRAEMASMRNFFDRHYGAAAPSVPLLRYYEDYYREHYREHLGKLERARRGEIADDLRDYRWQNPFGVATIDRILEGVDIWTAAVRRAWSVAPDAIEVNIDPGDVPSLAGIPPTSSTLPRSTSIFCQLVPDVGGSGARAVTNGGQSYLGFGKFFSRFLHVVPEEVAESLMAHNSRLSSMRLAEIVADGNFNGNLHPRLLPWDITYPTGDSDGGAHAMRCADLVVRADPDDPVTLALYHEPSGERVVPMDLGFLTPQRRPPMYQLLSRFAPCGGFHVMIPAHHTARGRSHTLTTILYRPRIVYDRAVVLARRRWSVPSALFPRRGASEGDWEYFERVNSWRNEIGIPGTVYVRVERASGRPAGQGAPDAAAIAAAAGEHGEDSGHDDPPIADIDDGEDMAVAPPGAEPPADSIPRAAVSDEGNAHNPPKPPQGRPASPRNSRDFEKPQFIDFASPLLADLFGRIAAGLEGYTVHIEEQYPDPSALPVIAGERYATEFILQFDWPAAGAPGV